MQEKIGEYGGRGPSQTEAYSGANILETTLRLMNV